MMIKNDADIGAELQTYKRFSRTKLQCTGCGYKGTMGLLHAIKSPGLLAGERILYAVIALYFLFSYFAKNETVAYTLRMVIPAVVFVIFIFVEQKLKTYTYACPNCKAPQSVRGSQ